MPNRMTGSWEVLPSADTSGGLAMWAREGTGKNNGNEFQAPYDKIVDLGIAEYFIDLPRPGEFKLFMRVWAYDKCGNSCWLGFDTRHDLYYFPGRFTGRRGAMNYYWPDEMYKRWLWLEDEDQRYSLDAGPHRLRIEVREDGFGIDQIALVPSAGDAPAGMQKSNLLPGSAGLPRGVKTSATQMSTRQNEVTTPFDCALAIENHVLSEDGSQTVDGFVWVRLNDSKANHVKVSLNGDFNGVTPDSEFEFELSSQEPMGTWGFRVIYGSETDIGSHDIVATALCDSFPDLTIRRTRRVVRAFDWCVTGPMDQWKARQVIASLRSTNSSEDLGKLARGWKKVKPRTHYDNFGAVDFNKVLTGQRFTSAIAATRISVKKSGRYFVLAGGDDNMHLYCGKNRILSDYESAPLTDTLAYYPVDLTKGDHLLYAQVDQYERWWQMFVEFQDQNGKPTRDIIGLKWND